MRKVGFAGICQGREEYRAILRVLKSKWHGSGFEAAEFEKEFANYIGVKYVLTVNSGSSGLLLALSALGLPVGSKILTSACGFPSTLSPIIHLGFKPVLVDYKLPSHNIDLSQVEEKLKKGGVKAIVFAHTMGNPVDMDTLMSLAKTHKVKVIEDCCEAVGAKFGGKQAGSFGDFGIFSFYPSHQINGAGMGGAVVTNNRNYALLMRSMRNWGKIARHPTFIGDHKTDWQSRVGAIPYDDQYTYQTIGYNMLLGDLNCGYLRVQLGRLPEFIEKRRENWEYLSSALEDINYPDIKQGIHPKARPSHFGFIFTLPPKSKKTRDELSKYLEKNGIRTRPFFAGNITRHQPFKYLQGNFPVADYLMKNSLFVGVWPGLSKRDMVYVAQKIKELFKKA